MGREKAGVVPIVLSCWSESGEAVGGVFGIFVVGLWDGTGLNNRTGIENRCGCAGIEYTSCNTCTGLDKTVSSCGNTRAVRVFVVRANLDSSSSGMTIMRRILSGPLLLLLLLLLLWSGMSIPGVLFAIPWLVLLWHALGLVGVLFASVFIEFR